MEPSVCFLLLSAKILKTSEGGANIDFLERKIIFFKLCLNPGNLSDYL